MICFKKVRFSYEKDIPVLKDADLEFGSGLTLLLGPNGCGKSTLLKLAAGVEKPDSGTILVDGHDLWKAEVAARENLTYLSEHPDLTPYATLREVLNLVCRLRNKPLSQGEEALRFVGLQEHAHRTVRELSLGQRRRAVLAACLVGSPAHILLDEPFEGMDRTIQREILSWINERRKEGDLILVASHTIEPFVELVSQAVSLKNGEVFVSRDLPAGYDRRLALLDDLSKAVF